MKQAFALLFIWQFFATRVHSFIRKDGNLRFSQVKTTKSQFSLHAKSRLRYRNADEMLQTLQQDNSSLVVLLFTAVNCGPCRLQKKELHRLHEARKNRLEDTMDQSQYLESGKTLDRLPLKILTIDTERWPHVGSKFQIGKLPCLFLFRGSQTIQRFDGLVSAEEIWKYVEDYHHSSDVQ